MTTKVPDQLRDTYPLGEGSHDALSVKLWNEILDSPFKDQAEAMMKEWGGDIDPTFLGFIGLYKSLSECINLDTTIYDIGCAYNFQNYYFRKHKKYIAINPGSEHEIMKFENTEIILGRAQDILPHLNVPNKHFAICSAVPSDEAQRLTKLYFKNCFVWYPS